MRSKPFITREEIIEEYIQDMIFRAGDVYDGKEFGYRGKNYRRRTKKLRKNSYIAKGRKLPF